MAEGELEVVKKSKRKKRRRKERRMLNLPLIFRTELIIWIHYHLKGRREGGEGKVEGGGGEEDEEENRKTSKKRRLLN